jgi:hypothetical protein
VGVVEAFRLDERSVRDDVAVGAGVVAAFLCDARVLGGVGRVRRLGLLMGQLLAAADDVGCVIGAAFISTSCSTLEFLTIG